MPNIHLMFAKVWFIGMTIGGLFTLGYVLCGEASLTHWVWSLLIAGLLGWIVWFVVNVAMPWIEK